MSDQRVRTAMRRIADEATVVDLGPRVAAHSRFLRRRRRAAAGAALAAVLVVTGLLLSVPGDPDAAPPAERRSAPVVNLAAAPDGGPARASLAVVDPSSGDGWTVTARGSAVRLPIPVRSLPGAPPSLSAGGSILSFGTPGQATLVRRADADVTRLPLPDEQDHLVSVSPDGGTAAYAADNQVDAVELMLLPVDGRAATTVRVTTNIAAGVLVPIVWSDDGSAVLVLEGQGATRVDLDPGDGPPDAGRGLHLVQDVYLAHGWAASPDLTRFAMGVTRTVDGERRRWLVLDSRDGRTVNQVTRPAGDRLIGWTAEDRLVFWHRDDRGYTVRSTDLDGAAGRTELRVSSRQPDLVATWSEDEG
jgi:hypothetical protein